MKKTLSLILSAIMMLCLLAGCGSEKTAEQKSDESAASTEIIIFAAASLTETIDQIVEAYKENAPEVKITTTYGSSGDLVKQIIEGADCDIFISAGQKQMDMIDASKDADSPDIILPETRIDLLENKVALVVPDENEANINSFNDLKARLEEGSIVLAIGGGDVPVGQYTEKILSYLGLDKDALLEKGVITLGDDVKAIASYVKEGIVDCGIVYQTDAFSAELKVADTATEEMCGQVIYPAAILNTTKDLDASKALLDFISSDNASEIFKSVGFTPINK